MVTRKLDQSGKDETRDFTENRFTKGSRGFTSIFDKGYLLIGVLYNRETERKYSSILNLLEIFL